MLVGNIRKSSMFKIRFFIGNWSCSGSNDDSIGLIKNKSKWFHRIRPKVLVKIGQTFLLNNFCDYSPENDLSKFLWSLPEKTSYLVFIVARASYKLAMSSSRHLKFSGTRLHVDDLSTVNRGLFCNSPFEARWLDLSFSFVLFWFSVFLLTFISNLWYLFSIVLVKMRLFTFKYFHYFVNWFINFISFTLCFAGS